MRQVLIGWLIVVMVGCAGVSRVPLSLELGEENQPLTGRTLFMTTVSDPHAFAPTTQTTWIEACDYRFAELKQRPEMHYTNWNRVVTSNCTPSVDYHFNTATGYLAGLAGPLIQAGAIVGGAALIGDGLKHSGSNTTNTFSGGNASARQQQQGGFIGAGTQTQP